MRDLSASSQLIGGFYDLEDNSWRWTAREFVIAFPGAPERELNRTHTLKLNCYLPDTQLAQLGPLTLSAEVNGALLPPETFTTPGMHTYLRTLPRNAVESNVVPVVFYLDKSSRNERDLGIVVNGAEITVD